ncbi:MAG: exodeoxyribonuclease VII small subunit [Clostridia bacterium]
MEEKEMNFEDSIKELENIANELEKGNLTLDESVNKFEQGMKLSKKCSNFLDSAEKKITMLINNNGEIEEENFIPKED